MATTAGLAREKVTGNQLVLGSTLEYGAALYNVEKDVFLLANIRAPSFEAAEKSGRQPIDLVCVIDKSASMAGEKIVLTRKTLAFMVDQLKDNDRIAIVTFDSNVTRDFELTNLDAQGKKEALRAIEKIKPTTCTNLSGGLFEGLDILRARSSANEVTSLLLFTDGLANRGITQTPEVIKGLEQKLSGISAPITIYTFGYGEDHDANMLTPIAQAANGTYHYLSKEEDIPKAFAECLGGLLSVAAQKIQLTVEAQSGCKVKLYSTNYKKEEPKPGQLINVDVGDLYSDENRDIMFSVTLPQRQEPVESELIAKVTLTYQNLIANTTDEASTTVVIRRPDQLPPDMKANTALDKQRNRVEASIVLDEARRLADEGQFDDARAILQAAITKIKQSVSANDYYVQSLISDLSACLATLQDNRAYESVGSKMLNTFYASNSRQRSVGGAANSAVQDEFLTTSKRSMRDMFSFIGNKKR